MAAGENTHHYGSELKYHANSATDGRAWSARPLLSMRGGDCAVRTSNVISWQRIEFRVLLAAFRVVLIGLASAR
jgi:hypothetical protein